MGLSAYAGTLPDVTSISSQAAELAALPGLGPTSAGWLVDAGIDSVDRLEALGAVETYRRVRDQRDGVSLNLLYALDGALRDCHWTDITPARERELQAEVAAPDRLGG
jgi:DNA transformation protein and related proteins